VLTTAGFEAAHWSTLGANNAPDAEIMACARAHDYVVVTHDLDFNTILAATHGETLTRHVDRLCGRLDAGQKYWVFTESSG